MKPCKQNWPTYTADLATIVNGSRNKINMEKIAMSFKNRWWTWSPLACLWWLKIAKSWLTYHLLAGTSENKTYFSRNHLGEHQRRTTCKFTHSCWLAQLHMSLLLIVAAESIIPPKKYICICWYKIMLLECQSRCIMPYCMWYLIIIIFFTLKDLICWTSFPMLPNLFWYFAT